MKPLHVSELNNFLSRFQRFIGSEIKTITLKSPTVIEVSVSVQDAARQYDWIDLVFELSNVSNALLMENSKLAYLDMSEGITVIVSAKEAIFCYGDYVSHESAKDSPLHIFAQSIKFKELPFSG